MASNDNGNVKGRFARKSKNPRSQIKASPTFSVESNNKWGRKKVWALDALHREKPFTHFTTVFLGRVSNRDVSSLRKALCKHITNKKYRTKLECGLYGVLELTKKGVLHFHALVRNIGKDDLIDFLRRHNRKNNTKQKLRFALPYYEPIDSPIAAAIYIFKLGELEKILFLKHSLSKYTITAGNVFNGKTKHYEKLGRQRYFADIRKPI